MFTKIEQTFGHVHFLAKVFPTRSSVGALIRELDFNHATYPAFTDVLSQQAPTFRPHAIFKGRPASVQAMRLSLRCSHSISNRNSIPLLSSQLLALLMNLGAMLYKPDLLTLFYL